MLVQRRLNSRWKDCLGRPTLPEGETADLVKARKGGALPMLDRFVGGTERGSALGKFIEQSGVKTSVSGCC